MKIYSLYIAATNLVNPDQVNVPKAVADTNNLQTIFRVVFVISAAIAVLMVVIGGLSYVLSNGDPQKTAKAKDTILYSLIGLAVVVLASVIVSFAIGSIL